MKQSSGLTPIFIIALIIVAAFFTPIFINSINDTREKETITNITTETIVKYIETDPGSTGNTQFQVANTEAYLQDQFYFTNRGTKIVTTTIASYYDNGTTKKEYFSSAFMENNSGTGGYGNVSLEINETIYYIDATLVEVNNDYAEYKVTYNETNTTTETKITGKFDKKTKTIWDSIFILFVVVILCSIIVFLK